MSTSKGEYYCCAFSSPFGLLLYFITTERFKACMHVLLHLSCCAIAQLILEPWNVLTQLTSTSSHHSLVHYRKTILQIALIDEKAMAVHARTWIIRFPTFSNFYDATFLLAWLHMHQSFVHYFFSGNKLHHARKNVYIFTPQDSDWNLNSENTEA